MTLLAFIGVVVLFFLVLNARQRLSSLEARLANLDGNAPKTEPAPTPEPPVSEPAPQLISEGERQVTPEKASPNLSWLTENWLMKIGGILLLAALTWFVRYAFLNNWIGPVGRISFGLTVSGLFMWLGSYVMLRRPVPGQVLATLGTTGALLTVFAARAMYDFFTPMSSLIFMGLIVTVAAVIAVVHRTQALGIVSFLGAAIVPLLTYPSSYDPKFMLGYTLVLTLGALIMVWLRGWHAILLLSLLTTWRYTLPAFDHLYVEPVSTLVIVYMILFGLLYYVGSIAPAWRSRRVTRYDLVTGGATTLLMLHWIYLYTPHDYHSLLFAGVGLVPLILSFVFSRVGLPASMVYIHGGAALFSIGLATSIAFEGPSLVIMAILEVVALVALSAYVLCDTLLTQRLSTLYAIPAILGAQEFVDLYFFEPVLSIIAIFSVAAGALIIALMARHARLSGRMASIFFVTSGAFFAGSLWRLLEEIFADIDFAHGLALVVYALVGLFLLYISRDKEGSGLSRAGGAVLLLTVLRLVFVEIWLMPLAIRIVVFALIGTLLLITGFLRKNNA